MNVIALNRLPTLEDALGVIDQLRADTEEGKLVAFFAVGIADDDSTNVYVGTTRPISRLRVQGALTFALHSFQHGEVL